MIATHSLGADPFETCRRVARYYIDNGMTKNKARKELEAFVRQCEPSAAITKWTRSLDIAVSQALQRKAVDVNSIDITKQEMGRIDALDGKQMQRLAFTLLCLAKYWDIANESADHWVNSKDSEIMKMANINTSIKRQSLMYYNLNAAGMVRFARPVDNTNVAVCFMEPGDIAMSVTDFRNLGYQYLKYHGGPYFECSNCGVTTKYIHPDNKNSVWKQKYCKSCAAEIAIQQRVNYMMRLAESDKSNSY